MPISCTRVRFGVLIGPPNVSGLPNPASSMIMTRTLGASSGALGPGMIVQSATDVSIVRPIVPPKLRSGIGSTVRSGVNLPAASAKLSLRPLMPFSSICATDLAGESVSACSAASRSLRWLMFATSTITGMI